MASKNKNWLSETQILKRFTLSKNFWGSEPECFKWFSKEHLRLGAAFNTGTQKYIRMSLI